MKYTIISAHAGDRFWIDNEKSIEKLLGGGGSSCLSLAHGQGLWLFEQALCHTLIGKIEESLRHTQASWFRFDCDIPPAFSLSPDEDQRLQSFLARTRTTG